ncbi:MAG: DUF350 domain-containing protein [Thioalkalivibrionaceae bacterium]
MEDTVMGPSLWWSLAGIPAFLLYFGLAAVLLLLFARLYTWITPHREFELIRANNPAAAVAFGGALIGFALPLSSAISFATSVVDFLIWGLIALVVQLAVFFLARLVVNDLSGRITRGEVGAGVFAASAAVAGGLLNAASMTY